MVSSVVLCLAMFFSVLPSQAKPYRLKRWGIPKADYSGITPLGENRYAVVSDNEAKAGFYVWTLRLDSLTGKLSEVRNEGFRGTDWDGDRDAEGVAFCAQRQTVFVSGEDDQRILEHRLDGTLTGFELHVPARYGVDSIQPNRGFEALAYDARRGQFWTCTEAALRGSEPLQLDMLRFGLSLQPEGVVPYRLDAPQARSFGRDYYHGVVAITVLPDGRLLVLEREARIAPSYVGSRCWCKLFLFSPSDGTKVLLEKWVTSFHLWNLRFSNYEAMCLGPRLADGRQTLLLLCDSQSGAGRAFWHLKDRLKVLRLDLP